MSVTKEHLPLVSVVVLNWNGKRFIDPFLKSFFKQSYPMESLELLFVDNGSTDDSVEYLTKHYGDKTVIKLVENDQNYGYSGGNNHGVHYAQGDYILILNNDLELHKDLIYELVRVAQDKQASAVNPKLMYLNKPGIINNAGSELVPNSDWPNREIGKDEKDTGQYDKIREITAVCGAVTLYSREFMQTVGLFDGKFFMYFEDSDLSWRGQRAGRRYFYAPKAVAYHVHTGSSKEGSPLFNHFVGRNRMLILLKNAAPSVIARGAGKTLRDQLVLRVKRLLLAVTGKYPRHLAWTEFWLSQKMLWATLALTPYALAKRWHILHEETL